jgi:hypothetical protein
MEASGELHAQAALSSVPFDWEAGGKKRQCSLPEFKPRTVQPIA